MLGILVGLKAEARLIAPLCPGLPIEMSNACPEGARNGVKRLVAAGATELLSFGCAAGLAPGLRPGAIIMPEWVDVGGRHYETTYALCERFGADRKDILHGGMMHSDILVTTAGEKQRLFQETSCIAVDMESGFVARAGLPFAVLRVVCDDVRRDLPSVAQDVLSAGRISPVKLVKHLVRDPLQIRDLVTLGRDAATARRAMKAFLSGEHR